MRLCASLLLFSLFTVTLCEEAAEEIISNNPLAHGYGDDIEWVRWDDAIPLAKKSRKPVFLLIHKSWCHACQSLKLKFNQASALAQMKQMSENFIMVNCEDDEEPWEDTYKVDGKYIPRLYFLNPDGELMTEVMNGESEYEQYKYYYANPGQVFTSMQQVLEQFGLAEKTKKDAPAKPPAAAPPADGEDDSAKPPSAEPPAMEPPAPPVNEPNDDKDADAHKETKTKKKKDKKKTEL